MADRFFEEGLCLPVGSGPVTRTSSAVSDGIQAELLKVVSGFSNGVVSTGQMMLRILSASDVHQKSEQKHATR